MTVPPHRAVKRVLVVDDKEEGAYYLEALFRGHGWSVDVARDGAEALEKARAAEPDIIVSDLLMPVMDGYTLLRTWKSDDQLKTRPFVVFTATYTGEEDKALAIEMGADAFILKPCEPEELFQRVSELEGSGGAARPGASPASEPRSSDDARYSRVLVHKLEKKMQELEDANRNLRRDEADLRMLDRAIKAVSQGIVITDARAPDHPIVYVSPGFTRITGYEPAEVMGKNFRLLQGPGTDPKAIGELRKGISERRTFSVELLNYRKDGGSFWNNVTISPVVDPEGVVTQYIGVLTDVSDRRALEAQLRQAQKMEAVGRLAAGIAHDFNNLLSVILGYSSLLLADLSTADRGWEDIHEIHEAGQRARDLTQQLLAFSRQQVLELRLVDLGELVRGMERMLQRLLGADIELSFAPARPRGRVRADPSQIEQIVMNLAVNARDAMPEGGKLTVETADADVIHSGSSGGELQPGHYVRLTMTDTGIGMDAPTRERIFEPFFTTKEKGKGTGLGLSTVFGIVKQSRGFVTVESAPDKGASFHVYLPRVEQQSEVERRSDLAPSTLRGTETVLLVDDQAPVRSVTKAILERNGYRVIDVGDGEEALRLGQRLDSQIDLVITDVVMPRMNGKQFAERFAELRPGTRIMFMSGNTDGSLHSMDGRDLYRHYLQKPLTPETLLHKVRMVLDGAPPASGPPSSSPPS